MTSKKQDDKRDAGMAEAFTVEERSLPGLEKKEAPKEAAKAPTVEKPAVPDEPTITIDHFARRKLGNSPITIAFVSCEKRAHGVRKLSESKWQALFAQFKSAPR